MDKSKSYFFGIIALAAGLLLAFVLIDQIVDVAKVQPEIWAVFYFFTIHANIFALVWLVIFGVTRFIKKRTFLHKFADSQAVLTALALYMFITFFVMATLLTPIWDGRWVDGLTRHALWFHLIFPLVIMLFWFFLNHSKPPRFRSALYMLIYPIAYLGFNMILANTITPREWEYEIAGNTIQGGFAYPFINPSSYPHVALFILAMIGLAAAVWGLGVLFILIKRKLHKELN